MDGTDELLANNALEAARLRLPGLSPRPARRLAVVACMDARLDPAAVLGLRAGDAHVIRNAGGIVTAEVLRSLTLSQRLLGTEEIILIQHTGCGLLGLDGARLERELVAEAGARPDWEVGAFADLDESVRESLARIRSSRFIPRRDRVRGFVYEVETGLLREVTAGRR
ncbi:MAG TPA: carbonic anhydrase [Solirubrobacteraceae bacterium]|nr:carbonic anhydrase [Solirubrobacteraceae bacterium]